MQKGTLCSEIKAIISVQSGQECGVDRFDVMQS